MIPALLVLVILYFLAKILVGILVGLLGFPFLIRDLKFDMQWYHIILGTILLPFTLLFMVFLGLKLTLGK
jgi:hypothetical protein